jgi:hypothetical protein
MNTAIRTLAVIALTAAVPPVSVWFAAERASRLEAQCQCNKLAGLPEGSAMIILFGALLLLLALASIK